MFKLLTAGIAFVSFTYFSESFAQTPQLEKTSDGVKLTISTNERSVPQVVQLHVMADNIIRVTSRPPGAEIRYKSLMLADTIHTKPAWQLKQLNNEAIIETPRVNAHLSTLNGEVRFTDKSGRTILQEGKRGQGTFVPATYNGDTFFQIKQSFLSDKSEAYYGLGQHQSDIMNYKGRHVELAQYNTYTAIPFLISTKNYGILWDNYSITKAGDIRDPQPLSSLKLFSASGEQGWLTASYGQKDGKGEPIVRAESAIDYSYLQDMKNFPDSFNLANGKVRWEGSVESPYTGMHYFFIKYAGYLKVWIDGKLLADRWRQAWNAGSIEIPYNFEEGKKYKILLEWLPDGGESYLAVKWQSPLPENMKDKFAFSSEAGDQIDYYFIAGDNMDEVIGGYRTLTGRAPIMPKWAMGFWQSRERYKTQEEILNTVKTFREKRIPIDNIVLDWSYWAEDQWGSQEFEAARFPDPEGMLDQLHNKYHTHLMISVWPKFYKGTEAYNEFNKKGWLYTRNIADARRDWIGKGYLSTFYDPFNPDARTGFWNLLNNKLYKKGIDAWWLDATEPDLHSNLSVEDRKTIFSPSVGSSVRYFNAFPLENAKGVYEGQRRTNPSSRVFILTRSAYAGMQRYAAAAWSGDISSRWHDMKDQISAGINFSMSGLPYWTMDIGGFSVERRYENAKGADLEEWRELNARWFQFGTFTPIFRSHGQYPYREMFNIAPDHHPAYKSMLYYDKLRYRLLPYIYSLAGKAYFDNYTIMRGLPMDFQTDTMVRSIGDQFMFGPSLLVNPVYTYKSVSRKLYLPAGTGWFDLYTGKYYPGGKTIEAAAPYERMPLFVKEGSIIPAGPEIQYTSEKAADPITLYVYTGKNASFELYEDEGINYNYEKGKYSIIPFSYNEKAKSLTIGSRQGSFEGMLQSRAFNIVVIKQNQPEGFTLNQKGGRSVQYTGKPITIKL